MTDSRTYQSKLYLEFLEIAPNEYRGTVTFVEEHLEGLKRIPFNEYFEILLAYLNALFEIGHYRDYLRRVDLAIEASILKNIKEYNGCNVYEQLLFRKAASNYNIMEYKKAEYIIEELIKINPLNKGYSAFLKRALHKNVPDYVMTLRAAGMFAFMLSAFVISIELLVIRNFFEVYATKVEFGRNIIFVMGWVFLLGGELFFRYGVHKKVEKFVAQVKMKKHITKIEVKELV